LRRLADERVIASCRRRTRDCVVPPTQAHVRIINALDRTCPAAGHDVYVLGHVVYAHAHLGRFL
jgi:hypothetical protein